MSEEERRQELLEQGVVEVLRMCDIVRAEMIFGNTEAGRDGMRELAEFFDGLPSGYVAKMVFILANQIMHGDALTREEGV